MSALSLCWLVVCILAAVCTPAASQNLPVFCKVTADCPSPLKCKILDDAADVGVCVECGALGECDAKFKQCSLPALDKPLSSYYSCQPIRTCVRKTALAVLPCEPGYTQVGSECVQNCWGGLSKACGTFCTRPGQACILYENKPCPDRVYTSSDLLCAAAVKTAAASLTANYPPCEPGEAAVWRGVLNGQKVTKCVRCPPTHSRACPSPATPGAFVCAANPTNLAYFPECPDVITPGTIPLQPCSAFAHIKGVAETASWVANGRFGRWALCPPGEYINAVNLKVAQPAGLGGDSVGATGALFRCGNGIALAGGNDFNAGTLAGWVGCSSGNITGVRLRSQKNQGAAGDDTATNGVQAFCKDGITLTPAQGNTGDWMSWSTCPSNTQMCGFQQQVEPQKPELQCPGFAGECDDTALNKIRVACC